MLRSLSCSGSTVDVFWWIRRLVFFLGFGWLWFRFVGEVFYLVVIVCWLIVDVWWTIFLYVAVIILCSCGLWIALNEKSSFLGRLEFFFGCLGPSVVPVGVVVVAYD